MVQVLRGNLSLVLDDPANDASNIRIFTGQTIESRFTLLAYSLTGRHLGRTTGRETHS